jgi:phosphonate transport system permease protein
MKQPRPGIAPASRPLVSPPVAAVLSLLVPGLGQALCGHVRRGLLMLGSLATIGLMVDWRMRALAPLEEGVVAAWAHAFARRPVFVAAILAATAALWLWIARDAATKARPRAAGEPEDRGHIGIFALVLSIFFVLGWQISRIDPVQLVTNAPQAWPPLAKVLWPWEAAIERQTTRLTARAPILSPCDQGTPPAAPVGVPGQPYVYSDPTCGELSRFDASNNPVLGTLLTVRGRGFKPSTETEIWWIDPLENAFRIRKGGEYLVIRSDAAGAFEIQVNMPYSILPPNTEGTRRLHYIEARQVDTVGAIEPSETLIVVISRMVETIFMGMMATLFGIILSIPVSFLASRNLMAHSPVTLVIYYVTRTVLNIIRSIEPLIWALIAVVWVGLGPFAGIIALTVHSVASLAKLYSEAIEGIDAGPIEAIQATGATRLQTIAYAVVPQMIPPFVSFSIYRWDINVRMSTVIGLVGGGGVGFLLVQYIRLLDYRSAGIAVWFIAITVATLDYVSAEIRNRFM